MASISDVASADAGDYLTPAAAWDDSTEGSSWHQSRITHHLPDRLHGWHLSFAPFSKK